jgi:hypothetical protein
MSVRLPEPKTIARLVSFVTRTMCGLEFVPASPGDPVPACWRLALLPIAGKRPLTVALFSDRAGCHALGAALAGLPPDQVDEPVVEDSLRELLNMAAGQLRRELVPDQPLGLPRVVTIESMTHEMRDAMVNGIHLRSVGSVPLFIWITEGALSSAMVA